MGHSAEGRRAICQSASRPGSGHAASRPGPARRAGIGPARGSALRETGGFRGSPATRHRRLPRAPRLPPSAHDRSEDAGADKGQRVAAAAGGQHTTTLAIHLTIWEQPYRGEAQ